MEYYIYVAHKSEFESMKDNPAIHPFVIVDRETGLYVVSFKKRKAADGAMSRILNDHPTRKSMMDSSGGYIRNTILPLFGY